MLNINDREGEYYETNYKKQFNGNEIINIYISDIIFYFYVINNTIILRLLLY